MPDVRNAPSPSPPHGHPAPSLPVRPDETRPEKSGEPAPAAGGPVWYYARNNKKLGPYFWEELRQLVVVGELKPEDMVWREGSPRWQGVSTVPGLLTPEPPPPANLTPAEPDLSGADQLPEELGRGDRCVVYKIRDARLHRLVALKMLRPEHQADSVTRQRFLREAQILAASLHASIVKLYEVGEHRATPYVEMELAEGGTLEQMITGEPMAAAAAAQIILPLAQALHAVHQKEIVHRNLEPSHVLFAAGGEPKLTGFGWARKCDAGPVEPAGGAPVPPGDAGYKAPEQARGEPIWPAADVYALGAILYALLTGRPPFRGATPAETLTQVIAWEPVPPSRLNPKVPRDLETICLHCLHKEPLQRYASALDLAEDLRRFLAHEPILAQPMPPPAPALPPPTPPVWSPPSPSGPPRPERSRWSLALVLLSALAGTAVSGWLYCNPSAWFSPPEQPAGNREADVVPDSSNPERDRRALYNRQLARAAVLWEANPAEALRLLKDPAVCPLEYREHDGTWRAYYHLCNFERDRLTRAQGEITALAATPDGTLLASGGADHTIRLWEVVSGRLRATLPGHTAAITALAFGPDGKLLVSGDRAGQLKYWDPIAKEEHPNHFRPIFPNQGKTEVVRAVTALAISPDGCTVAAAIRETKPANGKDSAAPAEGGPMLRSYIQTWEAKTGQPQTVLPDAAGPLAYSLDGRALATRGRVWDVPQTPRYTLRGLTGTVRAIAFTPDRGGVALGIETGRDGDGQPVVTAQLWDLAANPAPTPRSRP